MTCVECMQGVKTVTTSLAMEETKSRRWLIKYLGGRGFCGNWTVGKVGECREIVRILVEKALPVFASQNKTRSGQFCMDVLGVCRVG